MLQLALISLALSTPLLSTPIAWTPKLGSVVVLKWKAASDDYPGPNGVSSLRQEETDTDTIKEIGTDGNIVVEVKMTDIKAQLGDSRVASKAGPAIIQTITHKSNGEVVDRKSDSPDDKDNPRFDAIERLIYPGQRVNVGDSWSYKASADAAKGILDNESVYTFQGHETIEGVLADKIGVEYKESHSLLAMTASGTIWVAEEDGQIVKKDILVKNVVVGSGARTFQLRITVDRV